MDERDCARCGRPICRENKSGLCLACAVPRSAIAAAAKSTGWSYNSVRLWARKYGEDQAIRMAHSRTPPRLRRSRNA